MQATLLGNDTARWVTPPPAVIDEEIASAIRKAVKLLCDGIGLTGPLGKMAAPMELSGGYLNVMMTRSGGFLAHWEPDEDNDDDEIDEAAVLH